MIQTKKNVMFKNFNIVPRWFIFLLDIGGTLFSLFLAIAIKQNLTLVGLSWEAVFNTFVLVAIINTLVFTSIKTYSGIVRYTGFQDAVRIAASVLISSSLLFLVNGLSIKFVQDFGLTGSVLIMYTTFSFLFLISYRVTVKYLFSYAKNYKMTKKNVTDIAIF
jgi:FlaA1/EpsC-like NDP-sugar epimerase